MADSPPLLDTPSAWRPALEAARAGGTLFLVGATDSGKSTLAALLASEAHAAGRKTAVVDADIGQSSIGPPACIGMAGVHSNIRSLDALRADASDFVGASSPKGHLLQCAASISAMAAAARREADTVIVDTTGLIAGPFARAFKGAKVRLLDPDVVIALQLEDEVEHLVAPYRRRSRPHVVRLPVSRAAKERSREDRAARRQRKFAAYFAEGRELELDWEKAPIENSVWTSGEPLPGHIRAYAEECVACEVLYAERRADGVFLVTDGPSDTTGLRRLSDSFDATARTVDVAALESLLVGLLGERGETLALALLESVDFRRRRLALLTPLSGSERVHGIRLGSMQVARDGTQMRCHSPGTLV